MKEFEKISLDSLDSLRKSYLEEKSNTVLRHALSRNSVDSVASSLDEASNLITDYEVDVKTLKICDQKQSGRCWIFAGCNILREQIAKKLNITDMFEISQNYVAYFDKLEKCNYFLESVIDLIDKDPDDRYFKFIVANAVSDGGQWDMYVNIVRKYGICPKNNMVETYASSCTREMNGLLNSTLRKFAADAKRIYDESKDMKKIRALKAECLEKIYALLNNCFGVPPTKFDFEYKDKEGKFHQIKDLTPKGFFDEYIGDSILDYVSLINSPTKDKPFGKTYTIDYLNNVIEGKPVTHLNVTMDRMKELICKTLENNELVWFGSDVGNYSISREAQKWSESSFDYVSAFGLDKKMSKEDMLDFSQSCMNHAMVLCGFSSRDGVVKRWKIENSWGDKNNNGGYYMMDSEFFDDFVYQAVINKKYLNEEELEALKHDPIVLKPWDPMGTLAD